MNPQIILTLISNLYQDAMEERTQRFDLQKKVVKLQIENAELRARLGETPTDESEAAHADRE